MSGPGVNMNGSDIFDVVGFAAAIFGFGVFRGLILGFGMFIAGGLILPYIGLECELTSGVCEKLFGLELTSINSSER